MNNSHHSYQANWSSYRPENCNRK